MQPTHPRHQRGAAALGMTLLLLFVMALVAGMASRNLVFEQRSSANQLRSTRAFEAAEAGLEWAQALLNQGAAIGADCEAASATPGETSFRERFLAYDAASARFDPRTWADAGGPVALQAACVLTDSGWACSCPASGPASLVVPTGSEAHPAFAVQFVAVARSGMVQLVATGCEHIGPECLPGLAAPSSGRATARVQATLALLPALATLPTAALTARGDIAATGPLALVNLDPDTGGVTARAGGSIALPLAGLGTLPGRSGADSLVAHETQLGTADAERLLARLLGLDRTRWQQLPGVRRLSCTGDCAAELAAAIGPDSAHPLLWIEGDLELDGPLTLGSAERPLLIVVEGQLRLRAGVVIHGAVVTLAASWDTTGTVDAEIDGALVALGDVRGSGAPTIVHDAGALARLHGQFGSFTRVPGSWRDF